MGNSESQYTIQHSESSSCIIPDRPNHYSSKICSTGDSISLPCSDRNAGLRFRTPSKSDHTFISRNYEYISRKLKSRVNGQCNEVSDVMFPEGGLLEKSGTGEKSKGCDYYAFNTLKTTRKSISLQDFEKQSSPRVVIKKDDTGRVDFNHVSDSALLSDKCSGPVQLLRFSPTIESSSNIFGVTPSLIVNLEAQQPVENFKRTKGSSSTSDDSLFDLPWTCGTCVEPNVSDITYSNSETQSISAGKVGVFAQRSPDITIADLCKDPKIDATFLQFSNHSLLNQRSSFVSVMEESSLDGCQGEKQYSFFTLPRQKPKPVLESTRKSETIRNKLRHIRYLTGSLTRKKKKLQEPKYNEPTDCFDSGVDGLTADTSSPSQVSSLLGVYGDTSQTHCQSQPLQFCSPSDGALLLDTEQKKVYKNFMKELMAGQPSAEGGGEESSENFTDDTESSCQETLSSLKQIDLLFEKEQGVVRRAGWLHFKPLLTVHKDRKLELVGHRKWKKFWVTLKGCTLLFYDSYGKAFSDQELSPCCALLADDGIVQAVPEHPKKENVFCLSNVYGDVYLFQASNQTDLENWVTAIHSACASLFAKRNGKEDTLRLLHGEIRGILQKIDMDSKMKKMAELHLPIVGNPKNRKAIEDQIQQWEQNLERFNIDLFRMRCYLASRQGEELPNPKSLLATANRSSKAAVARLGIFSVSSFHALVCSRDEATMRKHSLSLCQHGHCKKGFFSSIMGLNTLTRKGHERKPSVSQRLLANIYSILPPEGSRRNCSQDISICVYMPNYQTVTILLKSHHTVRDVLTEACMLKGLDPYLHCLKLRRCVGDRMEIFAPSAHELLQDLSYDDLEVCQLNNFTLHISRPTLTVDFGFAVTGYVDSNRNSHITVSEVLPNGLAFRKGLRPGDEILSLNGFEVSSLDLALIPTLFNDLTVKLTVKRPLPSTQYHTDTNTRPLNRNRTKNHHRAKSSTDVSCAAEILGLTVDNDIQHQRHSHQTVHHSKSVDTVCSLYQYFQEDSGILMEGQREPRGPEPSTLRPYPWHMSATERLCKVIQELVDTEKSYVKDLNSLIEIYLNPLQKESFLTQDEMESLFGSLPEMLSFQKVFLLTLEEKISSSPNFTILETPVQFKKLLFSLGGSFLYYAEHFKLYCGFCANHIKVQKVLARAKTDRSFKEFLDARNPTMQHSTTLESYLIKPVQRVLKYPLLLRELVSLTDIDSEEHYHLTEALKEMEKVASHINEMQKIYEDYGAVFDQLVAEQNSTEKEVREISMGQFLVHSSVIWLNPSPSLGRMKKDPELTVFVFKRAVILLYREINKMKKKTPTSRSAQGNQVPFELRWLIPLSALQIRLGNTGETCWELIHTKSEKVGRPETVFQLCSSTLKCKLNIIKAIRSILRENLRQNMNRTEQPAERTCKKRLSPLRKTLPASAKLGSSRASWLCKKTSNDTRDSLNDLLRHALPDSDSTSSSSLTTSSASAPLDPPTDLPVHQTGLKESIIDEDNEYCEQNERQDSQLLGSAIETKFQKLQLTEKSSQGPAPCEEPETEVDNPERQAFIKRAHCCAMNCTTGRGSTNSFRREQVSLGNMRRHSHSLDSQTESMANNVDLNSLLEQDFSVQSLTSVVNEDIFYDNTTEAQNGAATTS